jgi:hypothetical protein
MARLMAAVTAASSSSVRLIVGMAGFYIIQADDSSPPTAKSLRLLSLGHGLEPLGQAVEGPNRLRGLGRFGVRPSLGGVDSRLGCSRPSACLCEGFAQAGEFAFQPRDLRMDWIVRGRRSRGRPAGPSP